MQELENRLHPPAVVISKLVELCLRHPPLATQLREEVEDRLQHHVERLDQILVADHERVEPHHH